MTLGQVRKHLPVRLGHRAATCILRSATTNIRIKAWAMTSLLTYALEVNTHYFDSKLILCSNILTNPTRSCIITLTQKGRCERLTSQSISSFVLGPVFGRPASNTGEVTRFLTLELLFRVTFSISKSVRELAPQEPLPDERYPPTLGLELLHVQPFRELFADHVLPPGESLQVKRVAFLFTDLLGSTAMYARKGDPRAFGLVREHFEVLFQAAERHRGITVKTIGDAVMASFMTSLDALRAAIDVHREIEVLNQQLGLSDDEALAIRQGIHVGPCISVTLNERLDYFGATVNIASRVSHVSHGNDVVLTQPVLANQETQAEAAQHGQLEGFEIELRGYEQSFQLQRLIFAD